MLCDSCKQLSTYRKQSCIRYDFTFPRPRNNDKKRTFCYKNHLLVMLISILVCLLFLSVLVVSGPYLTLSSLIIICTSLLLRCLLSDMSGSLFSDVIMLSPLIFRMLIYIFLLLSIIVISYNLFGAICHISGRFYLLGWPQPSLKLSCSFAIARVSVLLSI